MTTQQQKQAQIVALALARITVFRLSALSLPGNPSPMPVVAPIPPKAS